MYRWRQQQHLSMLYRVLGNESRRYQSRIYRFRTDQVNSNRYWYTSYRYLNCGWPEWRMHGGCHAALAVHRRALPSPVWVHSSTSSESHSTCSGAFQCQGHSQITRIDGHPCRRARTLIRAQHTSTWYKLKLEISSNLRQIHQTHTHQFKPSKTQAFNY